jgi:hypothetical protein
MYTKHRHELHLSRNAWPGKPLPSLWFRWIHRASQRVLNDCIEDQAFWPSYDFADGDGGEGKGAKSYDDEKVVELSCTASDCRCQKSNSPRFINKQ